MTPQDIFSALFNPQAVDSPQALEMLATAQPSAGMNAGGFGGGQMSGTPMMVPTPPSGPFELQQPANAMRGPTTPAAAPAGNVLARLTNPSAGSPNAGLVSMANLKQTSDPWLAFAQGYGGAQKAQNDQATSQRKSAAELYKAMMADARALGKDKRDDRRLDSEIEAKKEANTIARERIGAYKEVAGGKEQNGVDADYKRAITRKNLLGELSGYRTQLGLEADDSETIPSRKLPPEERARREALYKAKEAEIGGMLPRIGAAAGGGAGLAAATAGDDEDDPASIGSAPPMRPPRPNSFDMPKPVMALPDGMTHESALSEAQAAIQARPEMRSQIIERLTSFGIPTDGF